MPEPSRNAQTLLVVDDDRLILKMMEHRLRHEGYETVTAASAQEALELNLHLFDAILCDFTMPGMNGAQFLQLLREERECNCPFIFITATREPGELQQTAEKYQAEILSKPINNDALQALLRQLLSGPSSA